MFSCLDSPIVMAAYDGIYWLCIIYRSDLTIAANVEGIKICMYSRSL